ncbi:MAG: hypothetical protein JWO44_758 [Bacteroidetes bacterium]|nr:hypothetical protein [Bacteroidota bacterium]
MSFILPLIYSALFIVLICRMDFFKLPFLSGKALAGLFVFKLLAALIAWLVFAYYYGIADFFLYFKDSSALVHNLFNPGQQQPLTWNPLFNDSLWDGSIFMIGINGLLHLFSFGNYYVHAVFFCFFSFIGLTGLLKAFNKHFPGKRSIVIALFFIPGIWFWGSAPVKESVVIGICGLLVWLTDFGLKKSYTKKEFFLTAFLLPLLAWLKLYVFCALLPVLLVNMIITSTSPGKTGLKYIGVFAGLLLFAVTAASVSPGYNVLRIISDRQAKAISEARGGVFLANEENFISVDYERRENILELQPDSTYKIKDGSSYLLWQQNNMADTSFIVNSKDTSAYTWLYSVVPAGSVRELKKLKPVPADYLAYAPFAFFDTLMQPTFGKADSWLELAAFVENCWIMLLIIVSLFFFDQRVLEKKEILFFCLFFSVMIFVLIGITTPAIGGMVRYKTIGLLFLTSACFLMLDEQKLKAFFRIAGAEVKDDVSDLIDDL